MFLLPITPSPDLLSQRDSGSGAWQPVFTSPVSDSDVAQVGDSGPREQCSSQCWAPAGCCLPLCWFPAPAQCLHILVPPPSFSESSQVRSVARFTPSVYLPSRLPDESIRWLQNIWALGVSLSLSVTVIHVGHHVHITRVVVSMPFPFWLRPDCECSESKIIFQSSLWSESPA